MHAFILWQYFMVHRVWKFGMPWGRVNDRESSHFWVNSHFKFFFSVQKTKDGLTTEKLFTLLKDIFWTTKSNRSVSFQAVGAFFALRFAHSTDLTHESYAKCIYSDIKMLSRGLLFKSHASFIKARSGLCFRRSPWSKRSFRKSLLKCLYGKIYQPVFYFDWLKKYKPVNDELPTFSWFQMNIIMQPKS